MEPGVFFVSVNYIIGVSPSWLANSIHSWILYVVVNSRASSPRALIQNPFSCVLWNGTSFNGTYVVFLSVFKYMFTCFNGKMSQLNPLDYYDIFYWVKTSTNRNWTIIGPIQHQGYFFWTFTSTKAKKTVPPGQVRCRLPAETTGKVCNQVANPCIWGLK